MLTDTVILLTHDNMDPGVQEVLGVREFPEWELVIRAEEEPEAFDSDSLTQYGSHFCIYLQGKVCHGQAVIWQTQDSTEVRAGSGGRGSTIPGGDGP